MAYIGSTPTSQSSVGTVNFFNGDSSTVAFTLTSTPQAAQQVTIYINNVWQNPASAYSIAGNVVTFTSAPPTGASNIVVQIASGTVLFSGATQLGVIAGGAGTQFYSNSNTISTPTAIPANTNTVSFGPIVVNAPVSITSGTWKII